MTDELKWLSIEQLIDGYRARLFSPIEIVGELAEQIEAVEPLINAFTTLCLDRALSEAERSTKRLLAGTNIGALEGIPFAAKDLLDSEGVRTTYGSAIYRTHVATKDAATIAMLRAAGAILMGKTQTHEFAWGITTENPHYGSTRNPWNSNHIAGGSSGGSAAALSSGEIPFALGTDTGGSLRIPAAFCGVVGHRPTFGLVNPAGSFRLAPSLDVVGPMARTPADARRVLRVLTHGTVLRDEEAGRSVLKVRFGIDDSLLERSTQDVVEAIAQVKGLLQEAGATPVDIKMPDTAATYDAFEAIQRAEAFQVHNGLGLYPAQAAAYSPDVAERLARAQLVSLREVVRATQGREELRARGLALLRDVDILLTPVVPCPPLLIGEDTDPAVGLSFRMRVLPLTVFRSLAGLPACSIPVGLAECGLPNAVQLTGAPFQDDQILAVGSELTLLLEGMPSPPLALSASCAT